VPENDSLYTHTLEGADDIPAHIKASLTATSFSIPVSQGELMVGAWQAFCHLRGHLWEHRTSPRKRRALFV